MIKDKNREDTPRKLMFNPLPNPCAKTCDGRNAHCHATCAAYKAWKDAEDAKNAAIREAREEDRSYREWRSACARKYMRSAGVRW